MRSLDACNQLLRTPSGRPVSQGNLKGPITETDPSMCIISLYRSQAIFVVHLTILVIHLNEVSFGNLLKASLFTTANHAAMSTLQSSDLSDEELSLLEEKEPSFNRVSLSSSSSSGESDIEPDEAGLITSDKSRVHKQKSASPEPASESRDASTIVRALSEADEQEEEPLTPRDVNRVQTHVTSNGHTRRNTQHLRASQSSAKDKTRQNLTLREQEKASSDLTPCIPLRMLDSSLIKSRRRISH